MQLAIKLVAGAGCSSASNFREPSRAFPGLLHCAGIMDRLIQVRSTLETQADFVAIYLSGQREQ